MSPELIAIIGSAIALAGLILRQGSRLDDLADRVSRIEGLLAPRPWHSSEPPDKPLD